MILTEFRVEVALRHFGHVILVQKLARVSLLAEAAQPVFADDGAVSAQVAERTEVAAGAPALGEEVAHARHRLWEVGGGGGHTELGAELRSKELVRICLMMNIILFITVYQADQNY